MKSYLITDPRYYTNDIVKFKRNLQTSLDNHQVDMICFRDKVSSNFEVLANIFVEICRENNIKEIFINQNINIAHKLKVSGVHLTSLQFDKIQEAKILNLKTIISCHTKEEIQKAIDLNVDFITYSPIFDTPNKGEPKGIDKLKEIVKSYNTNILALGGIVAIEQIEQIKDTNCYGFASIRYFTN
ncbi:MAG TPA: thiamine phosphate synthase [Arcobacter sp.]|nr:thiamine phosphate synthase [Arcobacter sp.]HIP56277.1 thiamine phosphate synthase [Arcobacter sp.]